MLKKENRITTSFEFNVTRKYGKSLSGKYFKLFYLFQKNYKGPAKVGIVITNKVLNTAVKRNRLKRVFRVIVRSHFDKIKPDLWIVIHPRDFALEASYEEIDSDFTKVLQKAHIFKNMA